MAQEKNGKSSSEGYFRKNFEKLKYYQHFYYMVSRVILAATWSCLVTLFCWDAVYFHAPNGVSAKYLSVLVLIVSFNGLRKTILRFIQMREQSVTIHIAEEPHDPNEPRWWKFVFRLPFGLRRGLVGALVLSTEGFFTAVLFFSVIALGLNEGLFTLSSEFPFVMKPIILSEWMLPENSWTFLAIMGGAFLLSQVNNAIFLMKYPQVREAVLKLLNDYLLGLHPAHVVAGRVVEHFSHYGERNVDCCPEEVSARLLALMPHEKQFDPEKLVDRELRIRELVAEIVKLLKKNGKKPPYDENDNLPPF